MTPRSVVVRFAIFAALAAFVSFSAPEAGRAQEPVPEVGEGESSLRVFLDCATWRCREQRIRQDLTWVTWVQEPQDAQLFILMTGQQAGGGFQYTFDFEGQGPLEGLTDRYLFTSSSTDVEEEVVTGLIRTLSAGLVRFVALSGFVETLEISGAAGTRTSERERARAAVQQDDPWDYWVFFISGSMELEREDRENRDVFRFRSSANRTTEAWKIDLNGNLDFSRRSVEFDDGRGFVDERDDWNVRLQVVNSLSDHWSVGFLSRAFRSVRFNRDLGVSFSPALEWNYYPWGEFARHRFVVLYALGFQQQDYDEVTVYDQLQEFLVQHQLDVQFRVQEAWGNVNFGIEAQQFLSYTDQYSLELDGEVDYRLIRGLGLNIGAAYEIIRDQRFLSGEGLSPEEILTSRRALATGSRFSLDIGISYRFGSIFNNIVNARFPGLRF